MNYLASKIRGTRRNSRSSRSSSVSRSRERERGTEMRDRGAFPDGSRSPRDPREPGDLLSAPPLSPSFPKRTAPSHSLSSEGALAEPSFSDGYDSDDSAYDGFEQRSQPDNSYFGLTAVNAPPDASDLVTTVSAPPSSHGGASRLNGDGGALPRVSSEPRLSPELILSGERQILNSASISRSPSTRSSPGSQHGLSGGMSAKDYQKKFGEASRDLLNFVSSELGGSVGRPSQSKFDKSKKQVLVKFPVWRVDRFGERASRTISIEFEFPKANSESSRPNRRLKVTRSISSPLAFQGRYYVMDLDTDCGVSLYYDQEILSLRIEDPRGIMFGAHHQQKRTYQFHSSDDYDSFVSELNNVTTNLLPIEARPCEVLPPGGVDSLSKEERAEFKLDGSVISPESNARIMKHMVGGDIRYHAFLIRHGESLNNVLGKKNVMKWVVDPPLNDPNGWRQASELGEDLRACNFIEKFRIGRVYCSPLRRCMQTAYEVFVGTDMAGHPKQNSIPGEKIVALPQISEVRTSIGDIGHEYEDLESMFSLRQVMSKIDMDSYRPKHSHWWPYRGNTHAEAQSKQMRRVDAFLQWLKKELVTKQYNIVVVGHSHFFQMCERFVLANALQPTDKLDAPRKLENCSVLQLTYNPVREAFEVPQLFHGDRKAD